MANLAAEMVGVVDRHQAEAYGRALRCVDFYAHLDEILQEDWDLERLESEVDALFRMCELIDIVFEKPLGTAREDLLRMQSLEVFPVGQQRCS